MKELPEHWKWVKLGDLVDNPKQDLVDGPFGSNLKSDEYLDKGIPVFKIQNIKVNRFVEKHMSFISEEKAKTLIRHSFQSGDLIITKLGEPLGLCCKVPKKYPFGVIVADLMRLRPSKTKIYDEYLINVINSDIVKKQFKAITKGTTRARVNLTIVRDIQIPVPSKSTQQAIVSKIEELFSELDKGIENLRLAQQQLKTYRQSVLKWAFEGKLTNENVKDGELPERWKFVELQQVCEIKRGKSKHRPRNEPALYGGKYPFIQTGDIRNSSGKYINEYSQTYSELGLKQSKLWPKGTLCITIAANIGETAILGFDACFPDSVVGLLSNEKALLVKYTNYYFISFKQKLEELAPATAQKNINVDILEKVQIPLAPIEEQNNIIQEIESRLSVADKMEESINQSLQKAEALRQSILKKAFEGKLI